MPNYLVMRVGEIPAVGQTVGATLRVENAPDEPTAVQQALAALRDGSGGGVVGAVLASNVTRHTFSAPPPNYTVT